MECQGCWGAEPSSAQFQWNAQESSLITSWLRFAHGPFHRCGLRGASVTAFANRLNFPKISQSLANSSKPWAWPTDSVQGRQSKRGRPKGRATAPKLERQHNKGTTIKAKQGRQSKIGRETGSKAREAKQERQRKKGRARGAREAEQERQSKGAIATEAEERRHKKRGKACKARAR